MKVRHLPSVAVTALIASGFVFYWALPQDRIPHGQDTMPGPALEPEEALKRMVVPEGFTVELVASEPDVVNPVAMTFDERGRIWIAESVEYPRLEAGPGQDRVKVLEDTTGDGRADSITVFAEGLNIPSGIAVGHGGVWVANAPDILFMQDTTGDGKADRTEVVVTGFGRDDTHELPNSLTWGPDGYLYGLNGVFNPSRVSYGGETFEFTAAVFRIDPRTRSFELFAEGTSNPWGIAFDPEGNLFISACVIDHLWHVTETGYYRRQAGSYPPYTWRLGSIVDHRHFKAAYAGLVYHDSDAYPEPFRGRLYMGNIHGNSLNVDVLQRRGSTYHAEAAPDFFRANDAWSMPVSQKTGPDGSLYVLDWYDRYHCYQDARRDPEGVNRTRGRLYRIRYGDTPRPKPFDLTRESDARLIERLHDGNIYFRDTAQRLLAERNRSETRRELAAMVLNGSQPRQVRLHALWALVSTGVLEPDFHLRLLEDSDAGIRSWGVRAAGNIREVEPRIEKRVRSLASDPSPDVRLQVVVASAKFGTDGAIETILEVLGRSAEDPLIPGIAWQNVHPILEERAEVFVREMARLEAGRSEALSEFLSRATERLVAGSGTPPQAIVSLVELLYEQQQPAEVGRVFRALAQRAREARLSPERLQVYRDGLNVSLQRSLSRNSPAELRLDAALLASRWGDDAALSVLRESLEVPGLPQERVLEAIEGLAAVGDPSVLRHAEDLLTGRREASPSFQTGLLGVLGRFDLPETAEALLTGYSHLQMESRQVALELLTQRESWAHSLLEAVETGRVPPRDLTIGQIRSLLDLGPGPARRVRDAVGAVRTEADPDRERVVAEILALLQEGRGDPKRGVAVFERACASCHVIHGKGISLGPDLTNNGRASLEQLLSNVFDPNLVIGAGYQMAVVTTRDGRTLGGMLSEDSPEQVVVRLIGGAEEILPRERVESVEISELSFMPEGLERTMTEEELRNLISFLALDRSPDDPTARPIPGAAHLFEASR